MQAGAPKKAPNPGPQRLTQMVHLINHKNNQVKKKQNILLAEPVTKTRWVYMSLTETWKGNTNPEGSHNTPKNKQAKKDITNG